MASTRYTLTIKNSPPIHTRPAADAGHTVAILNLDAADLKCIDRDQSGNDGQQMDIPEIILPEHRRYQGSIKSRASMERPVIAAMARMLRANGNYLP
jgi:hypothetical protein